MIYNRIFKSWKSSLIGVIILLGTLGTVYAGKATLTEASIFIAAGVGAFFLNDGKKKEDDGSDGK